MEGVRVGRRVRVAKGFWLGVALGKGLAVTVGLLSTDEAWANPSAVELGLLVLIPCPGTEDGRAGGVATTCEGVG